MIRLDIAKVTDGVIVELEYNPAQKPGETKEAAEARFAGKRQWAKLAMMDQNANKRFNRRLEALAKPYRRQIQLGTLPEGKSEALALTAFLELILLDWGNIPIEGAIPFSVEGAKTILENPEWALFYAYLRECASDEEQYRKEELEADVKN